MEMEIVHQVYGHSLFFMLHCWDWFPECSSAASRNSSAKTLKQQNQKWNLRETKSNETKKRFSHTPVLIQLISFHRTINIFLYVLIFFTFNTYCFYSLLYILIHCEEVQLDIKSITSLQNEFMWG